MVWGTTIKNVYLSRVHKNELSSVREEEEKNIQRDKELLIALAAASPRDMKEWDSTWEDHVIMEIGRIFEELEESLIRRYLCDVALEDPDQVVES